jgi:hypothetical protein
LEWRLTYLACARPFQVWKQLLPLRRPLPSFSSCCISPTPFDSSCPAPSSPFLRPRPLSQPASEHTSRRRRQPSFPAAKLHLRSFVMNRSPPQKLVKTNANPEKNLSRREAGWANSLGATVFCFLKPPHCRTLLELLNQPTNQPTLRYT